MFSENFLTRVCQCVLSPTPANTCFHSYFSTDNATSCKLASHPSPHTLAWFDSRSFMFFFFQSWCTMMCLQSGKPSGRPSMSLLVTLSFSLPWHLWRSTGTSSWRTTWTSLTSLSSSMVKHAADVIHTHIFLSTNFTH